MESPSWRTIFCAFSIQIDRNDDTVLARLRDDVVSYVIYKDGKLEGGSYEPEWVENVFACLLHTDNIENNSNSILVGISKMSPFNLPILWGKHLIMCAYMKVSAENLGLDNALIVALYRLVGL